MRPDLFLGRPNIECEGNTNLLVAAAADVGHGHDHARPGVERGVEVVGELELTITPAFRTGPPGADIKNRLEIDPIAPSSPPVAGPPRSRPATRHRR